MSGPEDRFFARLRAAVLECPSGCGRLYELRPATRDQVNTELASKRHWDPLTGRFSCPGCGGTYQLGIVAYQLTKGDAVEIPRDWRPTIPQAMWMKDVARGQKYLKVGKPDEPITYANLLVAEAWPDPAAMVEGTLPPEPEKGRPGRKPPFHPSSEGMQRLLYGPLQKGPRSDGPRQSNPVADQGAGSGRGSTNELDNDESGDAAEPDPRD